ncbi:hypothetical protein AOC36_02910 [Erysipelothrix larvae]|uniref:Uncharacterized protein n=1 Tax=Erysipelothrix larvae TaxID=1514105 RepID=A0A109UGN6_9FIRM|nr:hypothetical protein [Erysipelothrix larvae]AMC92968.1 hypothetical protein AOC36_02910 [Erysipelothrix larvae]
MNIIKKVFNLSKMQYPWVLCLSIAAFIASFYIGRYFGNLAPTTETVMYGVGFAVALIWSILNYMSHLKIKTMYKKFDDIHHFVDHMTVSNDEKEELEQYLNDIVLDLISQGETHELAVKKAISHFQVAEFTEANGVDLLEKTTHYYLLGYASIFAFVFLIIHFLDSLLHITFILSALSLTLALYSIGLFCLFFLYQLIDNLITKK